MRSRILFTIILAQACLAACCQSLPTDPRLKGVETEVEKILKGFNTDGCQIVVVEKDKIIYSKQFGYFDHRQKTPVTENTVFPIASMTKPFTATIIGMLDAEKKLDIDKPVHEYYPNLEFYNDELTLHVTARDMMTHRTGLPRHDMMFFNAHTLPLDSIAYRIRFLQPSAPLRYKMQYSNLMFVTLGAVAQKVAGEPFEQLVKEWIFDPLEMRHTTLDASNISPCGGINSTATDVANWLITWINDGKFKGKQVIPESFVKEAMSSQMSGHAPPPGKGSPDMMGNYGLSWSLDSYRGHFFVGHDGDMLDFSSACCFFPTDSIGIVVLVNSFGSGWAPQTITGVFIDRLLRLPEFDQYNMWSKKNYDDYYKPTPADISHKPVAPCSHPLADYVGKYHHPAYGTIEIKIKGNDLVALLNDASLTIRHFSFDIYLSDQITGGNLRFVTDADGKISSIASPFEQDVADIIFIKQ
ncbi:MAG TPA: serine hydrolase [Mucilaginibacter sp.]|jgi:CubicO group peptidase (beta-lactamase class C family)|nr:serine hydrolase [Mucilaginibacter sp.]